MTITMTNNYHRKLRIFVQIGENNRGFMDLLTGSDCALHLRIPSLFFVELGQPALKHGDGRGFVLMLRPLILTGDNYAW